MDKHLAASHKLRGQMGASVGGQRQDNGAGGKVQRKRPAKVADAPVKKPRKSATPAKQAALETPPEVTEQPMDIHKPKPVHSVKELASEIGVIVIGILIALGLEQAVESYHARERAQVAREAIKVEIKFSLAKASVVAEMGDCSEQQLAAISDALGRGDQTEVERLVAAAKFPQPYTWSTAAWQNALASDAGELFTDRERRDYAILYGIVAEIDVKQRIYADSQGRLRAIALTGLARSPDALGAELSEVAEVTAAIRAQKEIAGVFEDAAQNLLGLRASKRDIAVLPGPDFPALCRSAAAALRPAPGGG